MSLGFDNFRAGLQTYFKFPFDVVRALGQDNWNFIGSDLYRTWTFMLIIVAISMLLWVVGRGIGEYYANRRLHKLTKIPNVQLA